MKQGFWASFTASDGDGSQTSELSALALELRLEAYNLLERDAAASGFRNVDPARVPWYIAATAATRDYALYCETRQRQGHTMKDLATASAPRSRCACSPPRRLSEARRPRHPLLPNLTVTAAAGEDEYLKLMARSKKTGD